MCQPTTPGRQHRAAATLLLLGMTFAPCWANGDTLNEALLETYLTNPDLEAERAQLRRTDELVSQAVSGFRPSLALSLGWTRQKGRTALPNEPTESLKERQTTTQFTASIQQNLFAGGGTVAAVRRAENLVRSERATLLATEQNVLFQAEQAYTAAWRARSVLDEALSNERRLVRQLQATRDRFELGQLARADVAQAEARRSRAAADVEAAKSDLDAANSNYERVIGKPPGNLADPMPIEALPATLDEVLTLAVDNPQTLSAVYQLDAAHHAVSVALADLLPSLDAQAQYQYTDQPSSQIPWDYATSFGVQLTVPLYQGGGEYSRVRESRQAVRQQLSTLDSTRRSVLDRARAAWGRRLAARAAIDSYRVEANANEVALAGVQEGALVGSRTVLDVLDAQQDLFVSRVNLIRSRVLDVDASYELKAVVGQLTVADLKLPVTPYDPDAYYERNRYRLFGIE
jgi:TolC family type I secretion outer membrane protein